MKDEKPKKRSFERLFGSLGEGKRQPSVLEKNVDMLGTIMVTERDKVLRAIGSPGKGRLYDIFAAHRALHTAVGKGRESGKLPEVLPVDFRVFQNFDRDYRAAIASWNLTTEYYSPQRVEELGAPFEERLKSQVLGYAELSEIAGTILVRFREARDELLRIFESSRQDIGEFLKRNADTPVYAEVETLLKAIDDFIEALQESKL